MLFEQPAQGWCCPSVWINPSDGSAWIRELGEPEGRGTRTKDCSWLLNADGSVRRTWDAPAEQHSCVAFNQQTGDVWVSTTQGLRRTQADGAKMDDPLPIHALCVSIDQSTGEIWAATKDALVKLDSKGKTLVEVPFDKPVMRAWVETLE